MRQLNLFKMMLLLCALIAGSMSVWAQDVSYTFSSFTSAQDVTLKADNDNLTITLAKGSAQNNPAWVASASEARIYAKGSLSVSSASKKIEKIVYSYSINANNKGTAPTIDGVKGTTENGTWDATNKTWTGGDNTVTMSTSGSAGNVGFTKIEVWYESTSTKTKIASINGISPVTVNVDDEGTFTLDATFPEGLTAGDDYEVTWATSDENVLAVDKTSGEYQAYAKGTVTITVNVEALDEDTYDNVSKTFEVKVIDSNANDGLSEAKAFTVTEAIAAIDAANKGTVSNVYVKGVVSKVDSYSSGKITYWISEDGKTTSTQFEVYNGLGIDGASFSSQDDVKVGDIVVITGNITYYSSGKVYEFAKESKLVSLVRKTASDLAVTSANPVAMEMTSTSLHPTSTIVWTTSSTGDMIFTSDKETVATVSDEGVVTAQGEGTATITIYQEADDTYAEGEVTVTVNVTDNRDAVATGIDLNKKVFTKGDLDELGVTATLAEGFTGTVTYSYTSDNTDVFDIDGTTYSAEGVGTAIVTITATPTDGNAANYKPASQEVVVTVNGENSITLNPATKSVAFSAESFDIEATVPTENYDGTVSAESSNTAVATVSVEGTTVTVTPVAVGAATITVTAGVGTYYLTSAQAACDVTITQPEGSEEGLTDAVETVFNETFDKNTNNQGGNDGKWDQGSGTSVSFDNAKGITLSTKSYSANKCVRLGTGSDQGSATITIPATAGAEYTLSFKAAPWNAEASTKASVTVEGGTIKGISDDAMTAKQWNDYSGTITASADELVITIASTGSKRFFLDEIYITKIVPAPTITAKLNAEGYATFCSQYPLDFFDYSTADYSAWQITDVNTDDGTISFEQVKGSVKGGTGLLLKGTAGATVTLTSVSSSTVLATNKLEAVLAPMTIGAGKYLGLSGKSFVKVSAGTVPAGKALLPASLVASADSRSLTFLFLGDNTTGVEAIRNSQSTTEGYYNLNGQRVSQPTRGLYIQNGRKVVVK